MTKIFAECHADTLLSMTLFSNCETDHASGHGATLNRLREAKENKTIALIDKSKTLASYFHDCELIKTLSLGVQLRKHVTGKKIIYLENGLENFLIDLCKQSNIDLKTYSLPNDQKKLGSIIKSMKVESNLNFKQLLNTIKQKSIPVFNEMKKFINS